jgi:IS605 OrfB family transposase
MTVEAAKVKVRRAIQQHTGDKAEQKRFYTLLKRDQWLSDPYLSRMMRRYWNRGHNHTRNQIIVRSDNYSTFQLNGKAWIKIPGLEKGKRIAIPLNTTVEPAGTLRVILRNARVEVHYAIDVEQTSDCGSEVVGVDKGYTEAFVDSDGEHHGLGLGEILRSESDYLKVKNQRRAKLRALARDTKKESKRQRIIQNNLGRKKLTHRAAKQNANVRNISFKAAHAIVDKASVVAAEDLTAPMSGKKFGKNMNRRLTSWAKGCLAESLETVCQRRGSTLVLVNPAYTSQMDSRNGLLLGKRVGDSFHCFDGVVLQADTNAARNVKARLDDPDIDRWTPYQKVKSILLLRTNGQRLGLLNPESS